MAYRLHLDMVMQTPFNARRHIETCVLMMSVSAAAGCAVHKTPSSPSRPGISIALTSAKERYRRGEQVMLTATITNGLDTACQVERLPDGVLAVLDLTRNGAAVTPVLTSGDYVDGFVSFLSANLVSVPPGGSIAIAWSSDGGARDDDPAVLRTSTLDMQGDAALELWPLLAPGTHQLSVRYVPPALTADSTSLCPGSAEPALISFTLEGE